MSNLSSYEVRIAARVPTAVPALIATAASRAFISPSAYIRQALAEKLQRDGLTVPVTGGQIQQAA